jgi:hypothetical protein
MVVVFPRCTNLLEARSCQDDKNQAGAQPVNCKGWVVVKHLCCMNAVVLRCAEQVDLALLVVELAAWWVCRIVRRRLLLGLVHFRTLGISFPCVQYIYLTGVCQPAMLSTVLRTGYAPVAAHADHNDGRR